MHLKWAIKLLSTVGTAPTTSPTTFSTSYLASVDCTKAHFSKTRRETFRFWDLVQPILVIRWCTDIPVHSKRVINLLTGHITLFYVAPAVLQLSVRPVAKCELWSGRATQILPNTGPTGNPRISFAKVHVRSSQTMQPCWTCGYQTMHIFFNIFMSDHTKFVWTI